MTEQTISFDVTADLSVKLYFHETSEATLTIYLNSGPVVKIPLSQLEIFLCEENDDGDLSTVRAEARENLMGLLNRVNDWE